MFGVSVHMFDRQMRESQQAKKGGSADKTMEEEEAALCMSVSERIFKMQNKIEEERYTPITPKSRSGAATPKTARSWSVWHTVLCALVCFVFSCSAGGGGGDF